MSQVPDTFGCCDNTIKVSAGHYVDLLNPDPATIDIRSIAAGLSKICRFGGQCPRFYSVAEHCCHALDLAVQDDLDCWETYAAVLMHDAAEAYLGDVVKPLKNNLPAYSVVEGRMEIAISLRFDIDFDSCIDVVKQYDRAMLKAEKQTMWPEDREKWEGFGDLGDREIVLGFWSPTEAEAQFLRYASELDLTD